MSCLIGMEPTRPGWPPGFAKARSGGSPATWNTAGITALTPGLQSERRTLLYVLVAAVVVTAFIIICVHCCKKKKTSAAEDPELVSLQTLDQHPVGTGDHRDATQLGFQPLMSAPGSTGSTEGA